MLQNNTFLPSETSLLLNVIVELFFTVLQVLHIIFSVLETVSVRRGSWKETPSVWSVLCPVYGLRTVKQLARGRKR